MSRNHDPTRARRHWIYSRDDIIELFSVSESTITNWVGIGLPPIDAKRPQLFAGYAIRKFLTNRRWRHGRVPKQGRLFCPDCAGFKPVQRKSISYRAIGLGCFRLTGKCTDCDSLLEVTVPVTTYPEIYDASANTPKDSSDVLGGGVLEGVGRKGTSIKPETTGSNLRLLYGYQIFLEHHESVETPTVDEHLRALARMSSFLGNKPFEQVKIEDVLRFKDYLRERRDGEESLSFSTVSHSLSHCSAFFGWLARQPGIRLQTDLPGYFSLTRREGASETGMARETELTFNLALCLFKDMPRSTPLEQRNRAIVALIIVSGIRVAALVTLRGRHVNIDTRWINQDPKEVATKLSQRIRTYCLDLGNGLIDAIRSWAHWREANGFGDDDPFFLPDRFLQPNTLGLGYRAHVRQARECWKSEDPVQRIIKNAAAAAGVLDGHVSSHDFRKALHPFLAVRGDMSVPEEVALQLNFGHTPEEVMRRHYAQMSDSEREITLNNLCSRALSKRSDLDAYLGMERGEISETDPDYPRAKALYEQRRLKG